jgi:hypothetical protein
MTRSILAVLAALALVAVLSSTGCQPGGVGDPCTPEAEYNPSFLGFAVTEVNTESESFQCLTRLCLVNHFQGRVSCPYGQESSGAPRPGAKSCAGAAGSGCCVPGTAAPITGIDPVTKRVANRTVGATVRPQCTDRTTDKAVYCSCRCANADGSTSDGATYCSCPDGFTCTQLVSPIGPSDQGLTGAYCIKKGTEYNPNNNCGDTCGMGTAQDPIASANCGNAQGVPTH